MAPIAAAFHGDPTSELTVVGITGTNGKTTTAFLVRELLEAAGRHCGLLGTVQQVVGGQVEEVERTTPEAIDLQRTFERMLEAGDDACAMEVSSHALVLHRADAIHFAVKVFTNLSQDHLDFHADMEDYFAAKRLLFSGEGGAPMIELEGGISVINLDDPYGQRLAEELSCGSGGDCITYSAAGGAADLSARGVTFDASGSRFLCMSPGRASSRWRRRCPATSTSPTRSRRWPSRTRSGSTSRGGAEALAAAGQVPGRFEPIDEGQPFGVIVDYAHTPDSLENVLRAARRLTGRQPDLGVRLRRRPRPREAPADGPRRGGALGPRGGHLRQPALRGPGGDHRADPGGDPGRARTPRSWSRRTAGAAIALALAAPATATPW